MKESRVESYKKISKRYLELFGVYLGFSVVLMCVGKIQIQNIFQLKEMYITPGLWDLTGAEFVGAFLFETPFALLRGLYGILFIFFACGFGYYAMKAKKLSNNEK